MTGPAGKIGPASGRWAVRSLAREAGLNTLGRTSRPGPMILVAILLGVVSAGVAALDGRVLMSRLHEQARRGANVVVLEGPRPEESNQPIRTLIGVASCVAATDQPGVNRAGPIVPVGSDDVWQLGPDVPVISSTASLVHGLQGADAVVGAGVSDFVTSPIRGLRFGALNEVIIEQFPEGLPLQSAVTVRLEPSLTMAPNCYLILDPRADPVAVGSLVASRLHVEGERLVVRPYLTRQTDPTAEFRTRWTRFTPVILAVGLALGSSIVSRLRMGEFGIYRLTGTSPSALYLILVLEHALVQGGFLTSATLATLSSQALISRSALVSACLLGSASGLLLYSIYAALQVRVSGLTLLKNA